MANLTKQPSPKMRTWPCFEPDETRWEFAKESLYLLPFEPAPNNGFANRIHGVNLENRLCDIETNNTDMSFHDKPPG